mmetsp:Transcript_47982/g.153767  ORF Transcript_47982/g.153767 Transcript_47982/m.153767 type:complete len:221 (-) Transcript_47982:338-1000(-)
MRACTRDPLHLLRRDAAVLRVVVEDGLLREHQGVVHHLPRARHQAHPCEGEAVLRVAHLTVHPEHAVWGCRPRARARGPPRLSLHEAVRDGVVDLLPRHVLLQVRREALRPPAPPGLSAPPQGVVVLDHLLGGEEVVGGGEGGLLRDFIHHLALLALLARLRRARKEAGGRLVGAGGGAGGALRGGGLPQAGRGRGELFGVLRPHPPAQPPHKYDQHLGH